MTNQREPLWTPTPDEIAALRRTLEQQDKRIAELEQQLATAQEHIAAQESIYQVALDSIEELEAQLSQTWQPVGHFKRACTCRDCRNLYGMENESLLTIQSGNNISNILSVVLPDDIRLCRLAAKGADHE